MSKIAIVGGYWGVEESQARAPFVGYSGHELTRMLADAGIVRTDCCLTNVLNLYKPGGDDELESICGPRETAIHGYPAINRSSYLRREFIPELERLGDEIVACDPNIIIALGNIAMWALLGKVGINKYRGVVELSTHTATGFKVLPTYNPAAIVRQWALRPTCVLDFMKALRESESPNLGRPERTIYLPETIDDLYEYDEHYIKPCKTLAVDIETAGQTVTCIGFAPDPRSALVVPFADPRRKDRAYWPTLDLEYQCVGFVRSILLRPVSKIFQNGLYDIAFLWRALGLRVMGAEEDTMLLHHALQPESLKGLGFLGSIYTDEGAWKQMRGRSRTIKRDE